MKFDLSRFRDTFFEESSEGLADMEASLLELDAGNVDSELIDTIFRAAHSIKGGAGTFGMTEIGEVTHQLETLLDQLRDGSREVTPELIDLLLRSADCIRGMLTQTQANPDDPPKHFDGMDETLAEISACLWGDAAPKGAPSDASTISQADEPPEEGHDGGGEGASGWNISFRPYQGLLQFGNEPVRIFRELGEFGHLTATADWSQLPALKEIDPEGCYLSWDLTLEGAATREELMTVFEWVEDDCDLTITPITSATGETSEAADEDMSEPIAAIGLHSDGESPRVERRSGPSTDRRSSQKKPEDQGGPSVRARSGSLRVATEKIDSLVNLVGEMVIVQSMLGEIGEDFEMSRIEDLRSGLEQLEQSTRELQESVMQVRMEPIGHAFQPMPRVVHDLSKKLGKDAQLTMSGEMTELDKTVAERISDSLMHLVRNALDHGLEGPDEREAAGKDRMGTVHLAAEHRGGQIVIEVRDDGAGLNPERIRKKAIEHGLLEPGDQSSDAELFDLIFHAGLSTAAQVSDVSGRGVGMDVVRKNIRALGGNIALKSKVGEGTTVTIQLPLTLAIVEGQLIRVGVETYIIPLLSIIESVKLEKSRITWVPQIGPVYHFRGNHIRIIPLAERFGLMGDATEMTDSMLVIVEGEGHVAGLVVDELLAHRQIVVKNLDNNSEEVDGIAGATILGDGTVALILNVGGVLNMQAEPQLASA
jgi:two-component system, chemotaxis family, sensor kinase CheA